MRTLIAIAQLLLYFAQAPGAQICSTTPCTTKGGESEKLTIKSLAMNLSQRGVTRAAHLGQRAGVTQPSTQSMTVSSVMDHQPYWAPVCLILRALKCVGGNEIS
jgi:hypothetical protein